MLFELWASVGPAGPQFIEHRHKRRAGRRGDNRVGVFRALMLTRHLRRRPTINATFANFSYLPDKDHDTTDHPYRCHIYIVCPIHVTQFQMAPVLLFQQIRDVGWTLYVCDVSQT